MQKKSELSIKKQLKTLIPAGIIAASLLFSHMLSGLLPSLFGIWDNQINDHLFRLRYLLKGKEELSPAIVNVALTDKTIKEIDLPVWDRKIFGSIIEKLSLTGTKAIALDLVFQDKSSPAQNEFLTNAAAKSGRVFLPVVFQPPMPGKMPETVPGMTGPHPELASHFFKMQTVNSGNPPEGGSATLPFLELLNAARGIGHINLNPDSDGKNRRLPLFYKVGNEYMPSFSLRLLCDYFDVNPKDIKVDFGNCITLKNVRLSKWSRKDISIPIDAKGQVILNFPGPWEDSFFQFPVRNIMKAEKGDELFSQLYDVMEDALVVISDVSTRNKDYCTSVFDTIYPLSGLHLTVLNMVLKNNYMYEPGWFETFLVAVVFGIVLFLAVRYLRPGGFYLSAFLLLLVLVGLNLLLFVYANRLGSFVAPVSSWALSIILLGTYQFFRAETEKRTLQVTIEANKDLAEAKRRFYENITHEMRTPLSLIRGPLDSLLNSVTNPLPGAIKRDLELMRGNTEKLIKRVDDLLDISKLEAGKMKLLTRETDMVELLDTVTTNFKQLAKQKGIHLAFKKVITRVDAFIDREKLEQVLSNLLMNALKFTGKGGSIRLFLLKTGTTGKSAPVKPRITIKISDTGVGIPADELPHIFDRFYQSEQAENGKQKGTGIGLSLVKEIVELHQGTVEVTSVPSRGTEFKIHLPLGKEHLAPDEIAENGSTLNVQDGREQTDRNEPEYAESWDTDVPLNRHKPDTVPVARIIPAEGAALYPEKPVVVVDDDSDLLHWYRESLKGYGITNISLCDSHSKIYPLLNKDEPGLIILDLQMPDITGEVLLEHICREHPGIPVIVVTGRNNIDSAVRCIRLGAFDYLVKPIELERLISDIRHCLRTQEFRQEIDRLKNVVGARELKKPEAFSEIVTVDEKIISLFMYMEAIAPSPEPVLITGENGAGKELFARALHKASGRNKDKFVAINVSSMNRDTLSHTLFGHKKGSFTGANSDRKGLVEEAAGGTLFLDEIGDLEQDSQIMLLRFLDNRKYRPLGEDTERISDVRVIVATNANLPEKLKEGKFRPDLFYRFRLHTIHVPALRERNGDLQLLVDHFITLASEAKGCEIPACPTGLISLLREYTFPGNVRELRAMIFDAVYTSDSRALPIAHFKDYTGLKGKAEQNNLQQAQPEGLRIKKSDRFPTLDETTRSLITQALERSNGVKAHAARLLGISAFKLHRLLKKIEARGPVEP